MYFERAKLYDQTTDDVINKFYDEVEYREFLELNDKRSDELEIKKIASSTERYLDGQAKSNLCVSRCQRRGYFAVSHVSEHDISSILGTWRIFVIYFEKI